MSIILGLDVSTSCTGICVLNSSTVLDDVGSHILHLNRIEFNGCKTLWDKADRVHQYLSSEPVVLYHIDRIVIEEPLMGFRTGMSSAQTITQLMKFNGICSFIARNIFRVEPEYIGSAHARKLCGVKLQRTALGGPQKEQVFSHMLEHDLKHVIWPLKKSGKVIDGSRDMCDAYVIARAAMINGVIIPQKKTKTKKVAQ